MNRAWKRWVPAGVVAAVIASAAIAVPLTASAAVDLPAKTPQQVLALLAQSHVASLSGTIEQTSNLGLPQLPTTGTGSDSVASSALSLLSSSYTARVYLDGPTKARAQVMDKLAERDVIRNGSDVWLYSSRDNTAIHSTLPAQTNKRPGSTTGEAKTPGELATKLLAAVDSTTTVSVGNDTRVAGRTAYDLVLTPRATDTLIGSVSIAVDSETGLPLSVELAARGQKDPAFSVAFSSLTLAAPSADVFSFTPPAGAKVKEQAMPTHQGATKPLRPESGAVKPSVIGSGWDSVLSMPAGTETAKLTSSPLFGKLTTAVTGGHLFHTALVNVFVTNDGRVFAGSVPVERLQAVAAAP
ncbi:LolA family protein [Lacisediminihabitans sp.]|jgi:outer membrane lipoprotein-sorting protein|uniref:LolA family protein n=1 Tax=Lacisediminihabitans sp. TaxID=2787631 RepID=UPI002F95F532